MYRSRAKHLAAFFGRMPVAAIRPEHVRAAVSGWMLRYRPATVAGIYAALSSCLKMAVRDGSLKTLPLPPEGPGIPVAQPRDHDLTLAQVELVLDNMSGTWRDVAELVLLTGLRWGEAVAITPDAIQGNVLLVRATRTRYGGTNPPKTRHGVRAVPLSARARDLLARLPLPVRGDYRRAREALVAAMTEAGVHRRGMGWHSLRAAHATLLDVAGMSLREQAARLGHGSNYAQTFAYRIRSEAGSADAIDAARHAGAP